MDKQPFLKLAYDPSPTDDWKPMIVDVRETLIVETIEVETPETEPQPVKVQRMQPTTQD
jgi:hypothetical protein